MNFLISFCLNNRITVILLTIALAIISIFVVKNIPVDVFPELKVPRVTIQTEAPGLTAEEVEQYITIPIESAMNGTAGVKGVRSSSGFLPIFWIRPTICPDRITVNSEQASRFQSMYVADRASTTRSLAR